MRFLQFERIGFVVVVLISVSVWLTNRVDCVVQSDWIRSFVFDKRECTVDKWGGLFSIGLDS